MNRGRGLQHNPAAAAERRARREARRAQEAPRPEDLAREARQLARVTIAPAAVIDDPEGLREWVRAFSAQPCRMCESYPASKRIRDARPVDFSRVEGHHVVAKQELKRWGLHVLVWDARNGIPLCRYHHFRHEHATQRVPRELLPRAAWLFADEINARFVLEDDRTYPVTARSGVNPADLPARVVGPTFRPSKGTGDPTAHTHPRQEEPNGR